VVEHVRRATNVVSLGMREYDGGEVPDAEIPQLRIHVRFRGPLVDEHRALGNFDQRGVSLADVQERDP
jgi:hypothetical protein